jgi:hypothetical protein
MPSNLALRTIFAGGIFLALLALFFTFPAIMAGDMDAFAELLKLGGAMSFALLIGVMILVLPLLILFGVIRIDARLAMALGGGIAAFALALFGLGGQSGDLSTPAVLTVTLCGAIAGWVYGGRKRTDVG